LGPSILIGEKPIFADRRAMMLFAFRWPPDAYMIVAYLDLTFFSSIMSAGASKLTRREYRCCTDGRFRS
jgi:hypothetical protein